MPSQANPMTKSGEAPDDRRRCRLPIRRQKYCVLYSHNPIPTSGYTADKRYLTSTCRIRKLNRCPALRTEVDTHDDYGLRD